MNGLTLYAALGDAAAVDLIGRGKSFTVIERDGASYEVPESSLSVQGSSRRAVAAPKETPKTAASNEEQESAEPGDETALDAQPPAGAGETPVPPEAKLPDKPKEETPEEKAARQADIKAVRALLDQGGAYFYDENDKPLSYEQVNTMIQEGDIEKLRAQGLHLSAWSPSLNEVTKEGAKGSTSIYGSEASRAQKKSVHEIVAEGKPFKETVKDNKPFDVKAYSAGVPKDGEISPLAVPEERRPLREVLAEDKREPFDPNRDYTENYLPDTK
jgi:hypothetical protein